MNDKTELEKAIELIESHGHLVVHELSLARRAHIGDISSALEKIGYHIVSATANRTARNNWNGTFNLEIVFVDKLKDEERKGGLKWEE